MAFSASRCVFSTAKTCLRNNPQVLSNFNRQLSVVAAINANGPYPRVASTCKKVEMLARVNQTSWSTSCRCAYSTENTEMMKEYLQGDIMAEKKNLESTQPPKGFKAERKGSLITLTKTLGDTNVTVKFDVNHSTQGAEPEQFADEDTGELKEQQQTNEQPQQITSVPVEVAIYLQRGAGKALYFLLTQMPGEHPDGSIDQSYIDPETKKQMEAAGEDDFRVFPWPYEVQEVGFRNPEDDVNVSLTNGDYVISGQIMDLNLSDMLLNHLEDLGLSDKFLTELFDYATSTEHQLYVQFLESLQKFIRK